MKTKRLTDAVITSTLRHLCRYVESSHLLLDTVLVDRENDKVVHGNIFDILDLTNGRRERGVSIRTAPRINERNESERTSAIARAQPETRSSSISTEFGSPAW